MTINELIQELQKYEGHELIIDPAHFQITGVTPIHTTKETYIMLESEEYNQAQTHEQIL